MFGNLVCGNVTGDAPVSYWPIFSLSLVTVPEVFAMFTRPSFLHVSKVANRPLPSSENPHFKNEAKCTNFHVKMSFICMRMKNHFHIKGWALNLVLIQRPGGTRKWSISCPLHSRLTYLLPSNTMNMYHTGDSMWGPWLVIVVYQVITEGGVWCLFRCHHPQHRFCRNFCLSIQLSPVSGLKGNDSTVLFSLYSLTTTQTIARGNC